MNIATLLVRLASLWLFGKSWIVLHEVYNAKAMMGTMGAQNKFATQQVETMQVYAIVGLVVGVGGIIFGHLVARILSLEPGRRPKSALDD